MSTSNSALRNLGFRRDPMQSPLLRKISQEMNYRPQGRKAFATQVNSSTAEMVKSPEDKKKEEALRTLHKSLTDELNGVEAELERMHAGVNTATVGETLLKRMALNFRLEKIPASIFEASDAVDRIDRIHKARESAIERLRLWIKRLERELVDIKQAADGKLEDRKTFFNYPLSKQREDVLEAMRIGEENLRLVGAR